MPFQKGNKLGERAKAFNHELRKVITQSPEKLRKAAEALLDMAAEGELFAIRELADRLDGKSHQTVSGEIEHNVNVGSSDTLTVPLSKAVELRTKSTVQ